LCLYGGSNKLGASKGRLAKVEVKFWFDRHNMEIKSLPDSFDFLAINSLEIKRIEILQDKPTPPMAP
jgi:hypothetical protein